MSARSTQIIVTKNIVTNEEGDLVQETCDPGGCAGEDGKGCSAVALREFSSVKVGTGASEDARIW